MNTPYRLLVVAPYEGFRNIFETVIRGRSDLSVDLYSASLEEIPDLIPTIDTSVYEAVICRGRSGRAVQELVNIPVINVNFSPFDILRGLELASMTKHKHMAFVSFFEMHDTVKLLCEILKMPDDILIPAPPENSAGMRKLVEKLRKDGVDFFIGDGACVRCARDLGAESLLITSGPESIRDAIQNAAAICEIQRKYADSNSFFRNLLQKTADQLAVYRPDKSLVFTNLPATSTALFRSMESHVNRILQHGRIKWIYRGEKDSWKFFGESIPYKENQYALIHIAQSVGVLVKDRPYFTSLEKKDAESDLMLVSNNASLRSLWDQAQKTAPLMLPLTISGSYCTGKITFAHALYAVSPFSTNSLLEIDCQILDERAMTRLLSDEDSPLFEKGCMILLKNLESLPTFFQKELANALTAYDLTRNSKFVATVNGNINQLVLSNHLLQDLASLLNGYTVHLPSLQETPDQIMNIARSYLNELNQELPVQIAGFEPEALHLLQNFNWEFGITQFKMVLKQVALSTTGLFISADSVRKALGELNQVKAVQQGYAAIDLSGTLDEITRKVIERVLEEEGMNQSKAAKRLGISRGTVWKRLREESTEK